MPQEKLNLQQEILNKFLTGEDGQTVFQRSKATFDPLEATPAEIEAANKNFMFMPAGSTGTIVS